MTEPTQIILVKIRDRNPQKMCVRGEMMLAKSYIFLRKYLGIASVAKVRHFQTVKRFTYVTSK